mgnify:CR=1 FL=1
MAEVLSNFLSAAAARGFAWGTHDCMLFAADWARARTGSDPAAAWRGTYQTEAEAMQLVAQAGGLAALMGRALEACGWRKGEAAGPGDVGVYLVPTPNGRRPVAGICGLHGQGAFVTKRGIAVARINPVEAWTWPKR